MFGGNNIAKTIDLIEADKKLIDNVIKQFGNEDSASKIYNLYAWEEFYKGNIKTAMRRFNQAWLLDSNNASAYFGFSAVLEVIKDNPDGYFETSIKIKEVEDPKKFYQIGIKKDENNKYELISLVFTSTGFETYGKTDLAIKASNKLLELTPNDTTALRQRGRLYSKKGEWEKAIVDFQLAYQNGSENTYLFNDLGYAYQENGDFENAFKFYEKSTSKDPTFLNPLYNSSLLSLKLLQFDKALEYIDKCISIKNDVGQFYKTKGEILIKLNKKKEGMICLKKAKKLGDKNAAQILKENK